MFLCEIWIRVHNCNREIVSSPESKWCMLGRTKVPSTLTRKQFLVQLCFAMTMNKAQDQTVSGAIVFFLGSIFGHRQVWHSQGCRVSKTCGIKAYKDKDGNGRYFDPTSFLSGHNINVHFLAPGSEDYKLNWRPEAMIQTISGWKCLVNFLLWFF